MTSARPWCLLLVLLATFIACKPRVGGTCKDGQRECLDAHSSLYCASGTWQLDACKGPNGCRQESGQDAWCDTRGALEGDTCLAQFEGRLECADDLKSRIQCRGGRYHTEQCKGPRGCTPEGEDAIRHLGPSCDPGEPAPGTSCIDWPGTANEEAPLCGEGHATTVKCRDGVYVVVDRCPGPNGCKRFQGMTQCDSRDPSRVPNGGP